MFLLLSVSFVFSLQSLSAQETFEKQIRLFDRDDVYSIHKRLYSKEGRHELSANFGGIFNHGGLALLTAQYQYHLYEALGIEAAAGGFGFQTADDEKLFFYQASLSFSPIYGKISWFTWAVLNFDLYTIGGVGVARYQGSNDGSGFAGNVGIGVRSFINEYLAAKIEFRDYIYNRKRTDDSAIYHNYALTAGISLFYPFKQDL